MGQRVVPDPRPGLPVTIGVSEAFFFTLVLLFGGYAAAVCVAIDGLLISKRRKHQEPYRIMFNLAEPVISVLAAAAVFYRIYGGPPLATKAATGFSAVLLPAAAMTVVYFLFNSGLNAFAVASETRTSPYRVWRQQFIWLSLTYFAASSVAILLAINWPGISLGALAVALPLVLVFWLTFRLGHRASRGRQQAPHRAAAAVPCRRSKPSRWPSTPRTRSRPGTCVASRATRSVLRTRLA